MSGGGYRGRGEPQLKHSHPAGSLIVTCNHCISPACSVLWETCMVARDPVRRIPSWS